MIKIDRVVIVEGRYDKIKLSSVIDAVIIETEGFGIFNNKEKQALIRRLADTKGLLILTDSDSAGFLIRKFLKSSIPEDRITHVYIPDVYGKEKRKTQAGKEGKLGVEGISEAVLLEAFRKAGVICNETDEEERRLITNIDLYEAGLMGKDNSKEKRVKLMKALALPERLSTSSLLKILNTFVTYEEFTEKLKELDI